MLAPQRRKLSSDSSSLNSSERDDKIEELLRPGLTDYQRRIQQVEDMDSDDSSDSSDMDKYELPNWKPSR